MIYIEKGMVPAELEAAKRRMAGTPNLTPCFKELRGDEKEAVLSSLLAEQGYLCAYCMARISREKGATIEHIVPQHPHGKVAASLLDLDYSNMLAVCDGRNGETCDKHRGNQELKVSPLNRRQMDDIGYLSDGAIWSKDSDINNDLNVVLNLNSPRTYLCKNRKETRMAVENALVAFIKKHMAEDNPGAKSNWCLQRIEQYEKSDSGKKEEFVGVKLYFLRRLKSKFDKQIPARR